MADRRRCGRFVIPEATEGVLLVMQDVYIERITNSRAVLLCATSLTVGDELTLELPRTLGLRSAARVEVDQSVPVWINHVRQYRVVVTSRAGLPGIAGVRPGHAGSPADDGPGRAALGILIRRVAVQIRDISVKGCQLESREEFLDGTVGQLELEVDGRQQVEPMRICRSTVATGSAWLYRSGAQFLGLSAPLSTSLRNMVARIELMEEMLSRSRPAAAMLEARLSP